MKLLNINCDGLRPELIKDIICGAPITLDEKSKQLASLKAAYPDCMAIRIAEEDLERALKNLRFPPNESTFTVESMWFDPDIFEEKKGSVIGICDNFEGIINCIKEDVEYESDSLEAPSSQEEDDWAGTTWYSVTKWDKTETGKHVATYKYYFDGTDAKWFEKLYPSNRLQSSQQFYDSSSLCLRTDYCKGDVLSIDCRPFRPRMKVEVLRKDSEGLWVRYEHSGNKIGECYLQNLGLCCYPINPLSPYYRLKRIKRKGQL